MIYTDNPLICMLQIYEIVSDTFHLLDIKGTELAHVKYKVAALSTRKGC